MTDLDTLEQAASDLYNAVILPETIWWDDLTPEMQAGWLRGAEFVDRRVAAAVREADALDVGRLAIALAKAQGVNDPIASAYAWMGLANKIAAEYAALSATEPAEYRDADRPLT